MITAENIKTAHSKVKSGADFPAYIQDLIKLGVTHYEAYVIDGRMEYHANQNQTVILPAKYDRIEISDSPDTDQFKAGLKAHQRGETDFLTFIQMCATCGVEQWTIRMDTMTCTYMDKSGNEILVEAIPQ